MEADLDLWPLVEGLTPLLEELERTERHAAGKTAPGDRRDDGQTIWARPGETTFLKLYSVAECRLAWAGAWAT